MNNEKTPDMTVLVVEDDELLNKSIRRLLEREGFTSEGFLSGDKVLERVFASSNDVLLLLDYSLPDLTAKEIVEKVRARGLDIPFVIITGHGDEQLAVEMMKLGALDYIVKSLQFHEVVPSKVKRACEEIANKRKLAWAEEALRESEEHYRLLYELESDAIVVVDEDGGDILEVNKAAVSLYGFSREEWLSMKNTDVSAEPDNTHQATMERFSLIPVRWHRKKDGTIFPVEITAAFFERKGRRVHLATIRDITERKRAEEEKSKLEDQLRQSQKLEAIGQLAGGVAHDFNNLLGGIMGNAELIKMHSGKDPTIDRYSDVIVNSSAKAADLTRQLLTFARKVRVNFTKVNIHSGIENVIELLSHTIDKRIEIIKKFAAASEFVNGDSTMLENALLNIAINARDAMPNGGSITFATSNVTLTKNTMPSGIIDLSPGEYICVAVTDSGTGMDKETQKRIFEPFFTTKELGKGTGLGLAAVYGCVRQHNGNVMVESELGKGSVFFICLPVLLAIGQQSGPAAQVCVKGKGNILIVDDEQAIGEIAVELLKGIGYTPTYINSPAKAIEYFKKNHGSVDAVILDIIMPKMNGLDVFRELKRLSPKVKVIIASGYSDEKQDALLVEEGVTVFVNKPYTLSELSTALAGVLAEGK